MENQRFSLRQKFENWLENIVIQTELKELKFEFEFDRKIPLSIESDAKKIQNIIINLAGNSIKHTNKGYINIKISLLEDDNSKS